MNGRTIINICSTRYLFKQSPGSVDEVVKFFNLSEGTKNFLTAASPGQCIISLNNTVTAIGVYGLAGCTKLTSVVLPAVRRTEGNSMTGCSALTKADFSNLQTIRYSTFYNNKNLIALIIRRHAVTTLDNTTNVFKNTPIESGTGYIYVPSDMVSNYKAATNWSTYANQIRAIEDYPDITGV